MGKKEDEEEAFEQELTRSFKSGKSAGMMEVANSIMDDALFYYRHGNDSLANELRKKAKQWIAKSEEEHPGIPK